MSEAPVVKNVQLEASRLGMRLLRNNRGLFLTLDKKRKVRAGLEAEGASDLIGFTPVVVTQAMVGKTLAVFTAAEVKEPNWTEPSGETEEQQQTFINQIIKRGGIAFFINNHENLKNSVDTAVKEFNNVFDKDGQDRL